MRDIISLMRPKHWIINVLIFIPAFFSKELWEPQIRMNLVVGFFCFSLVSCLIKTGIPFLYKIWCGIYFMMNLAYRMKKENAQNVVSDYSGI